MAEKGLEIQKDERLYRGSSYNLDTMKRDILTKLGRSEEALEDAWQNFLKHPHEFSHKELITLCVRVVVASTEQKKFTI